MRGSMSAEIINAVAHDITARIAPHELPLFRMTSAAYFAHPERVLQRAPRDHTLGFGVEGTITFMTPLVLAVVTAAVNYLHDVILSAAVDEGSENIRTLVRQLFKCTSTHAPPTVPRRTLTSFEISHVHQITLNKANALGLPEERARLLADAVIGSLFVESPDQIPQ